MKPNQFLKVRVFNTATTSWEDITNGILSIDTVTGSDTFQGFWDQPDTGQFVITTRGATADPNLNPLIQTNAIINIYIDVPTGTTEDIFYGFITDVAVKYNKNEKQTVTINGTDLMGYLNRLIITQDFIDTNITPTYANAVVPVDYLINYATYALAPEIQNFFLIQYAGTGAFNALSGQGGSPSPWLEFLPPTAKVKVEAGNSLYNLIALGMSSGLMRYECRTAQEYYFLPYYKNDPGYLAQGEDYYLANVQYVFKTNESDPLQTTFDNTPYEVTFKGINLNNGLNKMINQVSITNTDPADLSLTSIDPLVKEISIADYGPAELNASTSFTTTTNPFWLSTSTIANQSEYFQSSVLFDQATPSTTIESIIVDMSKYFANGIDIPDNGVLIFVQHLLDNSQYISGYFKIAGIKHKINESDWFAEIILRKSEELVLQDNRPKTPTFTLTADEAPNAQGYYDTETNFTLSINNYDAGDLANIDNIEWMVNFYGNLVNAPNGPGTPPSYINKLFNYTLPVFNGTSVTWSYDDTGVLQNYNQGAPAYGTILYGPGTYQAFVYITDKNGIKTQYLASEVLEIVAADAHADFIFTKNALEQVTFTDTSSPDTNTWSWNFGDGTTYNGKTPPLKQYDAGGSYLVTLTVNNGYDTDSITKQVDINVYQIPVKYVRLRFQGSVTRPAGQTEYPTDLIDTFGALELLNESYTQTGGIQPFNIVVRQLDKVQDIGRGFTTTGNHHMSYERIFNSDTPPEPGNYINTTDYHREWVFNYSSVGAGTTYDPYYTTDYSATSVLNPMSQTMWDYWNQNVGRGTYGGTTPKYRFFPIITNNIDGSQTKSYDFDLIFDYSNIYYNATYYSSYSYNRVPWRTWHSNQNVQQVQNSDITYIPGGNRSTTGNSTVPPQVLYTWPEWGTGAVASYNQNIKLKEIKIWPGMDTKLNKVTQGGTYYLPGGNTVQVYNKPVDPPLDRFGVQTGKEYLPITISVSDDGITYRRVADAEYVSGNTLTTTYVTDMPPFSSAPLQS